MRIMKKSSNALLLPIITSIIILAITGAWARSTFFPRASNEMLDLRKIESQLSLPEPTKRTERDEGLTTDFKRARHYHRDIQLDYDRNITLTDVIQRLDESGWIRADGYGYFYIHKEQGACAYINAVGPSTSIPEGLVDFIFIHAKQDDSCRNLSPQK